MKTYSTAVKLTLLMLLATATASTAQATAQTAQDSARKALVPPGLGTLKQDEFSVGLKNGQLLVKVTPLDEAVIRMAAPDTYTRLHALAESRRADAGQRTSHKDPELFLVSFFSYQPNVEFQPEDVQIEYNGRLLRAGGIIPLTPGWGKQLMAQQETQAAVYAFGEELDFELPFTVIYGMDRNNDWQRVIPKLQVEKNRILSK